MQESWSQEDLCSGFLQVLIPVWKRKWEGGEGRNAGLTPSPAFKGEHGGQEQELMMRVLSRHKKALEHQVEESVRIER